MKPWYRNSTLQMDDPEMRWLQSKDPASCAVWEWMKGDCMKRETDELRKLSPQALECVCLQLGISLPTFSQISQNLQEVGWVVDGRLKGWKKWNDRNRSPEEDALRKQVEYWKEKAESKKVTKSSQEPPHFLPKPPKSPQSEERRGEERRSTTHIGGVGVKSDPQIRMERFNSIRSSLNSAYSRDEAQAWSFAEEQALVEVSNREKAVDELKELLELKAKKGKYFPQSVHRLLETWSQTLDASRNSNGSESKWKGLPKFAN